jgi:hypothetical protein
VTVTAPPHIGNGDRIKRIAPAVSLILPRWRENGTNGNVRNGT